VGLETEQRKHNIKDSFKKQLAEIAALKHDNDRLKGDNEAHEKRYKEL